MNELHWVKIDRNWFYRKVMSFREDDELCHFVRKFASHLFFGDGEIYEAKLILEDAEAKRASYAERGRKGAEKRKENGLANSSTDSLASSKALSITEQNRTEQNRRENNTIDIKQTKISFKKPTLKEVEGYMKEQEQNTGEKYNFTAEYFFSYNETRDWILSNGKKMKCWQSNIATWKARAKSEQINKAAEKPKKQEPYCPPMAKPNKF